MKIFIRDFALNETVSTFFLVKAKEFRNKKGGGQYLTLTLADKTGEVNGHWWDNFEESADSFDVDDIVFARGAVVMHRNRMQLTVHRVRACEEREYDLADYFPTTKYNVDEMFASLMNTVKGFQNQYLRTLLENIFADETTVKNIQARTRRQNNASSLFGWIA